MLYENYLYTLFGAWIVAKCAALFCLRWRMWGFAPHPTKGHDALWKPQLGCALCLSQEAVDDFALGFLFRQAQGTQFGNLFPGNLTDGGLMDQAGLGGQRIQ